jgi:hypothetical protein
VTSGSSEAIRATSSSVAMLPRYRVRSSRVTGTERQPGRSGNIATNATISQRTINVSAASRRDGDGADQGAGSVGPRRSVPLRAGKAKQPTAALWSESASRPQGLGKVLVTSQVKTSWTDTFSCYTGLSERGETATAVLEGQDLNLSLPILEQNPNGARRVAVGVGIGFLQPERGGMLFADPAGQRGHEVQLSDFGGDGGDPGEREPDRRPGRFDVPAGADRNQYRHLAGSLRTQPEYECDQPRISRTPEQGRVLGRAALRHYRRPGRSVPPVPARRLEGHEGHLPGPESESEDVQEHVEEERQEDPAVSSEPATGTT